MTESVTLELGHSGSGYSSRYISPECILTRSKRFRSLTEFRFKAKREAKNRKSTALASHLLTPL